VEHSAEGMGSVIDGARWQVPEKMEAVRKTIPAKVSNSWAVLTVTKMESKRFL
jgi:hypothetical protein